MKKCMLFLLVACCSKVVICQQINYTVSFPNLVHHEARIALTVTGNTIQDPVFRMSRSSPGRYATHEFAKNVYDVTASDKAGKMLTINQLEGDVFQVNGIHSFINLSYTLYGNYADGTYADIDDAAVLLNMPASFMWLKGGENWPVTVHFNLPAGKHWTVATQLKPGIDSTSFSAPGLRYFMDSPVLLGDLYWHYWTVTNTVGKSYGFRLALNANLYAGANNISLETFTGNLEKLVKEAQAVYQETPAYDFGTYTFLASINPYVKDDGMEHRNSTMITTSASFDGSDGLLSTFAHEFFHCWNMKRMRPASLEPFNFEKSNMSEALWFAEGFTQYYGELIMRRAGFRSAANFENSLANWINLKNNTPAGKNYSPVQMSRKAVFTDAAIAIDRNNNSNNFADYYPYGAAIALALDLELKAKYHLILDDVMVAAWKAFGKTAIPYTMETLKNVVAEVTHDNSFADDFFNRYVYGHEAYDYNKILKLAGYEVKQVRDQSPWLGDATFLPGQSALILNSNTLIGSPLYQAGVDFGDQLESIDKIPIQKGNIASLLSGYIPGDSITLVFKHRGETKSAQITLVKNTAIGIFAYEQLGLKVTPAMQKMRAAWINSKVNSN